MGSGTSGGRSGRSGAARWGGGGHNSLPLTHRTVDYNVGVRVYVCMYRPTVRAAGSRWREAGPPSSPPRPSGRHELTANNEHSAPPASSRIHTKQPIQRLNGIRPRSPGVHWPCPNPRPPPNAPRAAVPRAFRCHRRTTANHPRRPFSHLLAVEWLHWRHYFSSR